MITNRFNQACNSLINKLQLTEDIVQDIKKYPELLQYFANISQNKDAKQYSNNPAFKQQMAQATQSGVVQIDPTTGQTQLRGDIIDYINSPDNVDDTLKKFQGQIVNPSATDQSNIQNIFKQNNTQAKQSLAKAQQNQKNSNTAQQQSTKPRGPIGSTSQTIGAKTY